MPNPALTLLPAAEVTKRTSISRTHIWRLVTAGEFPAPVKIVGRRSGWVESEVDDWIAERIAARDTGRGAA